MAKYQYEALNKNGKLLTGSMHATDEEELYQKLKEEENLYLVDAREGEDGRSSRQLSALMLSEFNRELADMLRAGVALVRALTILSQEETRKPRERKILLQVLKRVRQGESLSDALERQGGAFPILMINMYQAAQMNGGLAETAARLAVHYEKEHKRNSRVRSAMIYPRILCVLMVLVVAFIMSIILPQLTSLFSLMEELPLPTRILFGITNFISTYWVSLLVILFVLVIAMVILCKMPSMQILLDHLKLRLPYVGKLLMVVYTARFSRSLSSLYGAGIPIIGAMQAAKRTIGNRYIEKQFDQAIADLRGGKSLSETVEQIQGFRKKLASVIRVGEESGDLVQMLDSLADSFDYESEMAINRLLSILEPVLIVIMALVVGFIMVAVMLPIYQSYTVIGNSATYF